MTFSVLGLFAGCTAVPPTVQNDANLEYVELSGYKFHVRTYGDPRLPPLVVVHGGPGGDSKYLYPLQDLAKTHYLVFYDQRGTGLSPRVNKELLTLESSLDDLHRIVRHYGGPGQVKLIGHSWGAMLVVAYLGRHPDRVSHAVVVEPGMLNPLCAKEFVRRLKASQSFWDALPLMKYILLSPFVSTHDGHERFDYVMTRLMNRAKPGGPYQCEGESMPPNAFERAGYAAFSNMLKPVLDHPESFTQDLTHNTAAYTGQLLLLSSECSFIGYRFQQQFHMPFLPAQTVHREAKAMGHNMLTLNPAWSVDVIGKFLGEPGPSARASGLFAPASTRTVESKPHRERPADKGKVTDVLDQYAGSQVPGLQYLVVDADETLFEYAGGWADIQNHKAMTLDTTLMAYSMTKTFTAVAILQLVALGKLGLDDEIDRYLSNKPYGGRHMTIRQLLDHTSGAPNPIPLRWVHLVQEDASFDEDAALARVLRDHPQLAFEPGQKFAYSNIGYWLLGKIIEQATGQSYPDYVRKNIIASLGLSTQEMAFSIPNPARHANGYLAKYSVMNLVKSFVTDSKYWGRYEGRWLRLKNHQLNGPAFGGLVGTARGFSRFLQDQLQSESALFSPATKRLLETRQTDSAGQPIPMTLGWHLGKTGGETYFFKEGGGGGFHSEMRLYRAKGMASLVMVNSTVFNSSKFLNRLDRSFLALR
ncbi:alpha/beta fold hydrolase [Rhodoferax sp. UBA5149]|uniref:alpha/beta fold hydrolase n=1 Tax=Rhodoferax sp. UBA5149 TaxID=1947379 RepID=UPI0025CEBB7E|nr:alpha/beta fold hydrolase [Rhodoferax sp. UBA5149]